MSKKAEKVFLRLSADFVLSQEDSEKMTSKYITIFDKDGKTLTSGESYLIGYEDEEGKECDEEGNYL